MTSYNQEDYIGEAVRSAAEQDYENIQIVVSDDGSTDNSQLILNDLHNKYPGIIEIYLHKENRGSSWNHNFAYQQCRGEYICYFDGDDIMLPGKIEEQLDFMLSNPEYQLTYTNSEIFNTEKDKFIILWDQRFGKRTGSAKDVIRYGNFIPASATMFKMSIIPVEFNQEIYLGADWLFWIEFLILSNGEIGYLDKVLGKYRRHNSNRTLMWNQKIDSYFLTLNLIEKKYPEYLSELQKRRGDILLMKAFYLYGEKKRSLALKDLLESIKIFFPNIFSIFRLPFREIIFFLRSRRKFDDLIISLVGKE